MAKEKTIYLGYDPGGNEKHGVAVIVAEEGRLISGRTALVESAEGAIKWLSDQPVSPTALGVDTLTCWSTGPSGWRPADRWLKKKYPGAQGSVASANSLYGSMSVNGMAVLVEMKEGFPHLQITEAHPKVLHWHLTQRPYDFVLNQSLMVQVLREQLGCDVACNSDHEWDAVLSAFAAFQGASRKWTHDLHKEPVSENERLVMPCGPTHYFWPE